MHLNGLFDLSLAELHIKGRFNYWSLSESIRSLGLFPLDKVSIHNYLSVIKPLKLCEF